MKMTNDASIAIDGTLELPTRSEIWRKVKTRPNTRSRKVRGRVAHLLPWYIALVVSLEFVLLFAGHGL